MIDRSWQHDRTIVDPIQQWWAQQSGQKRKTVRRLVAQVRVTFYQWRTGR